MEIDFEKFFRKDKFTVIVNYPTSLKNLKENDAYITDEKFSSQESVWEFLNRQYSSSFDKLSSVLGMVRFSHKDAPLNGLTNVEIKKVRLMKALLHGEKKLVLEHFFEGMIFEEKEYFKRLFRNFMYKQGIEILFLENDMNFVSETVKDFWLYTKKGFVLKDDFYDEEIYEYVLMPYTVELIKYFESKGHKLDHDVTFSETLKSIYRGVS